MKVRIIKHVKCGDKDSGLEGEFFVDIEMPVPPFVGMEIVLKADPLRDPQEIQSVCYDEIEGVLEAYLPFVDFTDEPEEDDTDNKSMFEWHTKNWHRLVRWFKD